jgi:hypothetical protein
VTSALAAPAGPGHPGASGKMASSGDVERRERG